MIRFVKDVSSSHFNSDIFTIFVGPKSQIFTAHRDILSKSPKFKAQCNNEQLTESTSKEIRLRDHHPFIFGLLLEYLYKDEYSPKAGVEFAAYRSNDEKTRFLQTQREVHLYCMAGYYLVPELQTLAVEKMAMLAPLSMESFLNVSRVVYENNTGPGAYRDYFCYKIKDYLHLDTMEDWIIERIAEGGDLAVDIFHACRETWIAKPYEAAEDECSEEDHSEGQGNEESYDEEEDYPEEGYSAQQYPAQHHPTQHYPARYYPAQYYLPQQYAAQHYPSAPPGYSTRTVPYL